MQKSIKETPKNLTPEYNPISKEQDAEKRRQNEAELKKMWEKDSEMVRGIFRYHECPRGRMEFYFHKYKWDKGITYHLVDGEMYELPRGVAKHLNTNVCYNSYSYKNDMTGMPVVTLAEKIRRTSFQSLDYIDMGDPSMKVKLGTRPAGSMSNGIPESALPQ